MEIFLLIFMLFWTIGGAILINKSTEAGGFDWIKVHLRISWMIYLSLSTVIILFQPLVWRFVMDTHAHWNHWWFYPLCFLLGGTLFCVYFLFADKTTKSAQQQAQNKNIEKSEGLFTQNFPGISYQALIKLNDISADHRKYLIDFGQLNGSRFSVYISSDNVFTFSFIDAKGEPHLIQLPIGSSGIPFGKPFYLICELGIDGQSTLLRMLVDGKEIKSIALPFKLDLGGIDVSDGVIGADLNGANGASFDMGTMMIFRTTMIHLQIDILTKMILDYYQSSERHFLSHNGNQWMRVNKPGFQEPVQKNNKLFMLADPNFAVKFSDKDDVRALFQPETIAQINRVIAAGGTIVDEQWMDTVIRTLKSQGVYSSQ